MVGFRRLPRVAQMAELSWGCGWVNISWWSSRGSWSWSGEGAKRPTFLSSYGCAASLFSMVTSLVGRVELVAAAIAGPVDGPRDGPRDRACCYREILKPSLSDIRCLHRRPLPRSGASRRERAGRKLARGCSRR